MAAVLWTSVLHSVKDSAWIFVSGASGRRGKEVSGKRFPDLAGTKGLGQDRPRCTLDGSDTAWSHGFPENENFGCCKVQCRSCVMLALWENCRRYFPSAFESWEYSEARPWRSVQLPREHVVSELCLWALYSRVDWVSAVGLNLDPKRRNTFSLLLQTHVTDRRALLEVRNHLHFGRCGWCRLGHGQSEFVRSLIRVSAHPGNTAEFARGLAKPMRATTSGIPVARSMAQVCC